MYRSKKIYYRNIEKKHWKTVYRFLVDNNNNKFSQEWLNSILKQSPSNLQWMTIYRTKIVSVVVSIPIWIEYHGSKVRVANILFFDIKKELSQSLLKDKLETELCKRLNGYSISNWITTRNIDIGSCQAIWRRIAIPVHHQKLIQLEFIDDHFCKDKIEGSNRLEKMKPSDIYTIHHHLNLFLSKYQVKQVISKIQLYYLLTQKKVAYSFVIRNGNEITDFIGFNELKIYYPEQGVTLATAKLVCYYYYTTELSDLLSFSAECLKEYGIDQIIFNEIAECLSIDMDRLVCYDVKLLSKHPLEIDTNCLFLDMN